MKHIKTVNARGRFKVLAGTRDAQAAKMTLLPGGTSDDHPSNEHPRSEQWLFVISGNGVATVGRRKGATRRIPLSENSLLLIEKGELHQIRNTGKKALSTISFYAPPAYNRHGELKSNN